MSMAAATQFSSVPAAGARRGPSTKRRSAAPALRATAKSAPADAAAAPFGRRAAIASAAMLAASSTLAASAADADFVRDTRELIALQRGLLREGKGDVAAYILKADAYFSGYKWDHAGHTNSFAQLLSVDAVIKGQAEYLDAAGTAWSPDTVPASGTSKAKMLEAYLQNADRCVTKEGFGRFGDMTPEQRKEWKSIECSQGLVKPAD